jgi:hypothetical protein
MNPAQEKAPPGRNAGTRQDAQTTLTCTTKAATARWRMALTGLTEEELLEWLSTSDGLSVSRVLLSLPEPLSRKLGHEFRFGNQPELEGV